MPLRRAALLGAWIGLGAFVAVPLAAAEADTAALVRGVNARYYDLSRSGLRSFECMVDVSVTAAKADGGSFTLRRQRRFVFQEGAPSKLLPLEGGGEGEGPQDAPVDKVCLGAFRLWEGFINSPAVDPSLELRRTDDASGTTLLFRQAGVECGITVDGRGFITHVQGPLEAVPAFAESPGGLVLRAAVYRMAGGTDGKVYIQNKLIGGFVLPSNIHVAVETARVRTEAVLGIGSYKIDGAAVQARPLSPTAG